jgi:hypothetical protein
MKKYGLLIGVIILLLMSLAYLIMAINPVGFNESKFFFPDKKSKLLTSQEKIDKSFENKTKIVKKVKKEKREKKLLLFKNNEVKKEDDQLKKLFLEFEKLKKDVSLLAEDFYLKGNKIPEEQVYPLFLMENQKKYINNDSLYYAVKFLYSEVESLRVLFESISLKQNIQDKKLQKMNSRLSEYDSIVKNNMRYIMLMQIEQDSLFRAKGLKDSI